ncbi:MAG: methionine biosynthesis protein MetW [Betaproteobacteria bacterium SG8_41]|nr:MAG: methionine biosynthesis protein MetW [Betaproteobacteria bacterium SG8_41]
MKPNGNGMQRPDYAAIAEWVRPGSRVLDLGCGDGTLLRYLWRERNASGYGVEIDEAGVLACVRNGVNVIQSDLESGLSDFENRAFDYVILSQTLQAVRHSERIVREMLRVGREGIVTFPNFGYWKNRFQVALGKMPVSDNLPFQWYDTPNIHLCTITDFEDFCRAQEMRILERKVITNGSAVSFLPNLRGALAVYRFQRA